MILVVIVMIREFELYMVSVTVELVMFIAFPPVLYTVHDVPEILGHTVFASFVSKVCSPQYFG